MRIFASCVRQSPGNALIAAGRFPMNMDRCVISCLQYSVLRSTRQPLHAVATKQVSTALVPLPAVLPYLGAGRVKILAIAEPRRHPSIPHVQTTAQAGLADFAATGWFGVFAPAGTPQSVIHDLNAALARDPGSEQTRQVFSEFGLRLEHRAADAFGELLE